MLAIRKASAAHPNCQFGAPIFLAAKQAHTNPNASRTRLRFPMMIVSPAGNQSAIYCIRNVVSGRVYVGSAVNFQRRWALHRSLLSRGKHHSRMLQRSWIKHGPQAFVFEVLEFVEEALRLIEREQHWIDALNSICPKTGFNVAPKAGSSLGRKHPDSVKALMSARRKGTKRPPRSAEHRANLSASRIGNQWGRGIPKTAEHRAKLSAAKMGKPNPAIALSNRRRKGLPRSPFSPEHRANLSAAKKGRPIKRHKATHSQLADQN